MNPRGKVHRKGGRTQDAERPVRSVKSSISDCEFSLINPMIEEAAKFTLRGSKAVRTAIRLKKEGRIWVHGGVEHGLLEFHIGNTNANREIQVPNTVRKTLHRVIDNEPMAYTESQGIPELRESVAKRYGVQQDEVFIVNGVTHALELTALFFTNTGGHVVLTCPVYPPWAGILLLHGVGVKTALRNKKEGGKPNLEAIRSESAGNCCGTVLISADNPTSLFLDSDSGRGAANILRGRMVEDRRMRFLIIDDIYFDQIPIEKRIDYIALSEACEVPLICMGGIDKSIGTGLHGGYLIVHIPKKLGKERREKILGKLNDIFAMFLGANTLTQHAMQTYFDDYEFVRKEMGKNFDRFKKYSRTFNESAREVGLLHCFGEPEFPLYQFMGLPVGIPSEDFAYELVLQHGIAVTPGAPFMYEGGFRVVMMRDPMIPIPIAPIIGEMIREWI